MQRILIGIQARSTSSRLPGKAMALIAGRPMLEYTIGACLSSASHLASKRGVEAMVAVLVPKGDDLVGQVRMAPVLEGPEHDVLERYRMATEHWKADVVVRITGDCPLVPPHTISRVTALALDRGYDYVSNVDERFRTTIDGSDCEAVSRRLLLDTAARATETADREHVTTLIRREPPEWAKMGIVLNHFDLSWIKLSVDTEEDLARVRQAEESAVLKRQRAMMVYGRANVHTL